MGKGEASHGGEADGLLGAVEEYNADLQGRGIGVLGVPAASWEGPKPSTLI